ncbi:hypothetical protein RRG08_019926, partial [Elysia crispata]
SEAAMRAGNLRLQARERIAPSRETGDGPGD